MFNKLFNKLSNEAVKAAGVPIDEQLGNGVWLGVPNDCMAFDVAECWNTQKPMFFNMPGNDTTPSLAEGLERSA